MKHPFQYLLATAFLQPVWEFIGGFIGYALVNILSFGQIRPQGVQDAKLKFPWHGVTRAPDGKLVVESNMASLVGAIFLLGAGALLIFLP
jgi:hypothetical protein